MPNVHDDDEESLDFADESEWMDEGPGDDIEPNPNDPPSPAAGLLDALITDSKYDPDETASLLYGDIGDTNPAGIGGGAVRIKDTLVNAEFLVVAVPWAVATDMDDDRRLAKMWAELVQLARTREPQQ